MSKRILIVDDDQLILELLKYDFESQGFEVMTARNEEEFRSRALGSHKPDAIILDIMLGDKNGPLIYSDLIAAGLERSIPVVFLSALAGDRPTEPVTQGRSYSLYGKPFDSEELIRKVQMLVTV